LTFRPSVSRAILVVILTDMPDFDDQNVRPNTNESGDI